MQKTHIHPVHASVGGIEYAKVGLCRFLRSEAGVVIVWILGALILAAWISPWVCRGGQWLASEAAVRDWPGIIEWVAESCGRAKFSRYFNRSLMFSALILLPCLIGRIRSIRRHMPALAVDPALVSASSDRGRRFIAGFLIASFVLAMLCVSLVLAGAYMPQPKAAGFGKFLQKVLIPTLVAAPLEEWLFRGVLFGIWLRFVRPWGAVVGTSLMFSLLHFLEPPASWTIADPHHWAAGFKLLGGICHHFIEPLFFISDFATLCAAAMILGWARMRTGGLAFSIGIHAGWIAIIKSFSYFFVKVPDHPLRPWWVGDTVRSGGLSFAALAITAALCAWWLRGAHPSGKTSPAQERDGADV